MALMRARTKSNMLGHFVGKEVFGPGVHVDSSVPDRLLVIINSRPASPILSGILAAAFAATLYCVTVSYGGVQIAAAFGIFLGTLGFFMEVFLLVSREEYLLDSADRTITALRYSRLRTRKKVVNTRDIARVQLIRTRGDDYAYHVLLVADSGRVRVRLPTDARIAAASDCRRVGRALASELRVPLQDDQPLDE
jgi:hypothetical protein